MGEAAVTAPQVAAADGPSILVLFSDTGGGHRASAHSLEGAILQLEPRAQIHMVDPLMGESTSSSLVRRLAGLYSPMIQRSPAVWGAIYHSSNTRPAFAAIRRVFGGQVRRAISRFIQQHDPDLVLSVHPLLNHLAWQAIQRSGRRRGMVTVVTDLVEFHRGWMFPRVDRIVVPTEGARQACLRARVPEEKLRLLGLPVDLRFRPPAPGERAAVRRRLGLDQDRFTILVTGGGEGSGKLLQHVRALSARDTAWQLIVVCGRNEKLKRRLSRVDFGHRALILGFVDNMPDLMRAADLSVGKAGPGAIGEALATGVPVLLTSYLPGQETQNVAFVEEMGIGRYVPKSEQLQKAVLELAAAGSPTYRSMADRAESISRPYASLDIAHECLQLAATYSASSQASR